MFFPDAISFMTVRDIVNRAFALFAMNPVMLYAGLHCSYKISSPVSVKRRDGGARRRDERRKAVPRRSFRVLILSLD